MNEKSSKRQHPSSREIPMTKHQAGSQKFAWSFKFVFSLDVGAWNLEL
jgi:hypothetical protein